MMNPTRRLLLLALAAAMLNEREIESCYLGQFIPVHYHHNMLMDQNRMHGFKSAIFLRRQAWRQGAGTGRRHRRAVLVRGARPTRSIASSSIRTWSRKRARCWR
jgi:hypothetical protein